jgi:hypothetical protein
VPSDGEHLPANSGRKDNDMVIFAMTWGTMTLFGIKTGFSSPGFLVECALAALAGYFVPAILCGVYRR